MLARVVSGARVVSSAEKRHLIEAAPFGRLDQMLRTTVQGGRSGEALPPQPKNERSGGQRPPTKTERLNYQQTVFLEKLYQEKQLTVCI